MIKHEYIRDVTMFFLLFVFHSIIIKLIQFHVNKFFCVTIRFRQESTAKIGISGTWNGGDRLVAVLPRTQTQRGGAQYRQIGHQADRVRTVY